MTAPKILLICKDRGYGSSYGLLLSSRFVAEALQLQGICAKAVSVIDANEIDREVFSYKPTHVILEALWVTPTKMTELTKLYPKTKWIVRVHSEIPFIANEGIAFEWMFDYQKIQNVWVSSNSKIMNKNLNDINIYSIYLPNIYSPGLTSKITEEINDCENKKGAIDIGCFGAIRPLKNQLEQGVAAIKFANDQKKILRFHINASRTEQNGNGNLKNLRYLFKNSKPHSLIEHDWLKHDDFIKLIKKMDIGMQVSFSETFNIVTADFVNNNIPIIVSNEVRWMPFWTKVRTTSADDMVTGLDICYEGKRIGLHCLNKLYLFYYNVKSIYAWLKYVKA